MPDQTKIQIYHTINLIPAGKVASYGQIADLAGLPGRARLVGHYLKQSDDAAALPWYRVLKSNGRIAFPPGSDKAIEQSACLMSEGVVVKQNHVAMRTFQWQPELTDLLYRLKY